LNLIKKCLCCESNDLVRVLSFPATPLTDAYKQYSETSLSLKRYPLVALLCTNCSHLQLSIHVSAAESYTNYLYKSQVTLGLKDEFLAYAEQISNYVGNASIDLLDVGSNDGSFLLACKKNKINGIGVEPSLGLADYANTQGLSTINAFFDNNLFKKLTEQNQPLQYDVVSFNNVLANISNPYLALCLAKSFLKSEQSLIIVQTGYHPELFQKGIFDYIYHEHYSYFTLKSLQILGNRCNLKMIDYKIMSLRAGTVRCVFKPDSKGSTVINNIERFNTLEEFRGLSYLIKSSKHYLKQLIIDYRKRGYTIIGYGASHSTGTLVHSFEISKHIDFLVDENLNKQGKFMPGTSLQVNSVKKIKECPKSIVVVLAWQYYDQIRNKLILDNYEGPIVKPVLP
tara:strand:+ start:2564 stop:3757 length:1194 start_codon:yes stop_codon:yes gene_type:complete